MDVCPELRSPKVLVRFWIVIAVIWLHFFPHPEHRKTGSGFREGFLSNRPLPRRAVDHPIRQSVVSGASVSVHGIWCKSFKDID